MTLRAWPLPFNYKPQIEGARGGPVAMLRRFQPEVGIDSIERRAVTARAETWRSLSFTIEGEVDNQMFDDWFHDTVGQPFIFRHPRTDVIGEWKITSDPEMRNLRDHDYVVTLDMIMLPGTPWFASYVPGGQVRIPYFIADYGSSVFGVDGVRGVVGDLADVAGTFDVWTIRSSGSNSFGTVTYLAGEVPSSAPSGVSKLIGLKR
jgi:hypothetical protein